MTVGRLVRVSLLAVLAVAILVLSLVPEPPIRAEWIMGLDKIEHWIAYSFLGLLVYLTIQSAAEQRLLYFALTVFGCTMYGGLIEVLQGLTGRTPDIVDFFVNMFGATSGSVVGVGALEMAKGRRRR